jgi:hypothetical protein
VLADRPGHEQQIGVARTCHESNAQTLDVVDRIVERVNLEFAAVAGPGVDRANAECATHDVEDPALQLGAQPQALVAHGWRLGHDADAGDLPQGLQHLGLGCLISKIMTAV